MLQKRYKVIAFFFIGKTFFVIFKCRVAKNLKFA